MPPGESVALPAGREHVIVYFNNREWAEHVLVEGVYKFVRSGPVWELPRVH